MTLSSPKSDLKSYIVKSLQMFLHEINRDILLDTKGNSVKMIGISLTFIRQESVVSFSITTTDSNFTHCMSKHFIITPENKKTRKKYDSKMFLHNGTDVWNNLPNNLRQTQSIVTFKSKAKCHFFQ
eukprot:TCONS_00063666-protein